jgi:muconolactone delta-isomerase
MKFLVLWRIELALLGPPVVAAVLRMPEYAEPLEAEGKVVGRYHIVGGHGGAWIYDVASNEELELLLAQSPVYNYARYEVHPLADMSAPPVQPPAGS